MIRFWRQLLPAYIFTKPVFIGTYLWALLIHFADSINNYSGNVILRALIITTLHIGVYLTLFLFKQSVLDRVKPGLVPLLTLATLAFIGLARGFLLENWLVSWDISVSRDVGLRMQTSLIICLTSFSVGIVATANSRMHQIKSAQLLNELDRLEKIKVDALERIKSIDSESVEGIKNQLGTYVKGIHGKPVREILKILQTMIDSIVQPLSRQLEVQTNNWYPPVSREGKIQVDWIKAFKSGLNPGKISYRLNPILLIACSLPTIIKNSSFSLAFFSLLLTYCIGFFVGKFFNSIFINKTVNFGLYLFASVCTGFAMGLCTLKMTENYDSPYAFLILGTITYPITASLLSMVSSADAQLVTATNQLTQATEMLEWNVARIREVGHQTQRNLARALHGSVQARLASAYLELEKIDLEEVGNPERVNQILAEIQGFIQTFDNHQPEHIDISKLVFNIRENWASVAEVTCQISDEDMDLIHRDVLIGSTLIDVIPELVFNAIKHGKANVIDISIRFKNEWVVGLTVQDNGIYELNSAGSGLGTKILNESAISWSRERVAGQTVTRADFAFSLEIALPN
jgi:signal transduction histidine kinase